MKTSIANYLEKGYGQFPYIIVKWNDHIFQQIPIHRAELKPLGYEGIYTPDEFQSGFVNYRESCYFLFWSFWKNRMRRGLKLEMCLVINARDAYYLDLEGNLTLKDIPYGATLVSVKGEVIQQGGKHYAIEY